jgi:hypothetical protein
MIVEDDLDRRITRVGGIELLEEANELARAMAVFNAGMNLPSDQIDTRQRAQRPETLVFMVSRDTRMLARDRWQVRCGVGNRLDARLLVIGDERDVWLRPVRRC